MTPEKVMRGPFRNPGVIRAFLCEEIFIGDVSDSVSSKEKKQGYSSYKAMFLLFFYANIATRKDLL